jgi:hypothetical protein
VGVGELNHLWWLPLGLGCLVKAHRTGRWRWFGALSASLVGSMLSCFYLGFFLALSVLVWAICGLVNRAIELLLKRSEDEDPHPILKRIFSKHPSLEPMGKVLIFGRLFGQYALAAVLAVAVVWPVTQSFAASYKTGDVPETTLSEYVFEDHGQPVTDPVHERLDLDQLVDKSQDSDSSTRSEVNHERKEEAYGGGRYIGWFALGICVLGLIRRPDQAWAWVLVAGTGVLFSMGTYYTVDGVVYTVDGVPAESGGQRVQLPLFWLNRVLGYLAEPLNFPVRFLAMSSVAVAAMGALAAGSMRWPQSVTRRLDGLLQRLPQPPEIGFRGVVLPKWSLAVLVLAILAAGDVVRGQQVERPWASFTPRPAAELEALRDEPDLAVVDLALAIRSDEENRWSALATQIAHGKAMNAVPVERIEYFAREGAFFIKALQLVQDLTPLYQNIVGEGSRPGECSDGSDNDGDGLADCADQRGCERYAHCGMGGTAEDSKDSFIQYRPEGYYRGDFAVLRDAGFGWIVVSYKNGSVRDPMPTDLAKVLGTLMGPPVVEGMGLGAWEIPDVDYSVEELALWKAEHELKIATLEKMTPGMGPQRPTGPPPPRMEAPAEPPSMP